MIRSSRLEAALLGLGFAFQVFGAAALCLSPSVRAGAWSSAADRLLAFVPPIVWAVLAVLLHRQLERLLPNRDPLLLPAAMFLCGWGLQILVRLSAETALRQTLWLAVVGASWLFFLRLPRDLGWLREYRYLWLGGALAALAATLVIGVGAAPDSPRLWLGLDGIFFQPSEFLRWIFPVFAAFTLAPRPSPSAPIHAKDAIPVLAFGAAGVAIHILQQDLGAAMLLLGAVVLILYLAYRKAFILLLGFAAVCVFLGFGYAFNDTIRIRTATWWNPWLDPSNTSYQVVQSLIAVASGGLIGRGPGLGSPQLVPVAYSDFIFAAVAEEYGVLGAMGCLILYAVLVLRGLRIAARSVQPAFRLIAASLSALLGMQAVLIVAGSLRLLPLTGVTLPWMSYGGSSLLASTIILGILLVLSDKAPGEVPRMRPDRPVRVMASGFLIAFAAAGASLGWWGIFRAPVLRTRTDNYRRVLHDLQARRGDLFDRNGLPLAVTAGEPSAYAREYPVPSAAPVVGYTTAFYGQGGMEAALDPWLRGEAGRNAFELWWSETVLGIPLEGMDAWLAIDLGVQNQGSRWMEGRVGAAVVLRAGSGEILALISQPTFDPAVLGREYESLVRDPDSPLLNRATQGLFAPGRMLFPFFAAEALDRNWLDGGVDLCSAPYLEWIAADPDFPNRALARFRFDQDPVMDLPTANVPSLSFPAEEESAQLEFDGRGQVFLSPMQLALAFSAIAAGGMAPAPRLVLRLETPSGWTTPATASHPVAMLPAGAALRLREMLSGGADPAEWVGCGAAAGGIAWYAGFQTLDADPIVVVVALEGSAVDAAVIGRRILRAAAGTVQ
ncbi:MAG: FtsW/RodA/SpoVE family cell cycle protein [Anaerolineales bacterium]|nr:FtsW/RodA/SpoVE family cell cycle protein [Anaerolineales bacterium]